MPLSASCPGTTDVHVWWSDISALAGDRAALARAQAWLTAAERERYARFRRDDNRLMFLQGRVMARRLVGGALGVEPMAWAWREGPHGRPEIDVPATPLRFNIAHSAGLVACALSNGREVGVDLEHLARPAIDPHLVRRYCSASEAADVEAQGAGWRERFLEYWTLKEAYLKACGLGISVHLADISFTIGRESIRVDFQGSLSGTDPRWSFHLCQVDAGHLLSVAASATDGLRPSVAVSRFAGSA